MANLNTLRRMPSDWLKAEEDSYRSRRDIVVVSGAGVLESGTVLGLVTASGKYRRHTAAGADGGQTASAILIHPVDATAADARGVAIVREAIVAHQALTYGTDVTTAGARTTVDTALATSQIIVREGA